VERGTSFTSSVFTIELVLLNQLNGSSLGHAAPLIAECAGFGAIMDVLPPAPADMQGAILNTHGIRSYSAQQLGATRTAQPMKDD
jgi:hypothetical protein